MLIRININDFTFYVNQGLSVLQACESVNIFLPRFCYHERLSVAGNCRMCLVEINKLPKLQASCSILVSSDMSIKTEGFSVEKAREGILEFLLLNHPLDCPICDQGGECDLQDQTLIYGADKNRFKEFRRAIKDKNCSPLIKTVMTRCIHCTRCVRFANEVIGVNDFGTSGRGSSLEIGMYVNKLFFSEFSGNVIDLCPVGALTSKPYSFLSRPWELKSVESIDVFDSIHSNLRIDVRGYDIMRILPRLNESLNDEWISDKARFAFDGIYNQRITKPLVRNLKGKLIPVSWLKITDILLSKLCKVEKPNKVCFSISSSCDFESLFLIKKLSNLLNGFILNQSFDNFFNTDYQISYKFNTLLKNISESDCCLLIGINPKIDGVLLNYHLRKRFLAGNFVVASIGSPLKMSFPCIHLGTSTKSLLNFIEGRNSFCKLLRKLKKTMVITGKSLQKFLKPQIYNSFMEIILKNSKLVTNSWNGFNFFSFGPNDFSRFDLNLISSYPSTLTCPTPDILYILEDSHFVKNYLDNSFVIFQGHHFCKAAHNADLVLPSCSFLEKFSFYGNCEGRYQYSQPVISPLDKSKKSSDILSKFLKRFSPSVKLHKLTSGYLFEHAIKYFLPSYFVFLNKAFYNYLSFHLPYKCSFLFNYMYIPSETLVNFYQTDIISEMSLTMSKCSQVLLDKSPFSL